MRYTSLIERNRMYCIIYDVKCIVKCTGHMVNCKVLKFAYGIFVFYLIDWKCEFDSCSRFPNISLLIHFF